MPEKPLTPDEKLQQEFNRWAAAGEGPKMENHHLDITSKTIRRMNLRPGERVLDLGCGSGWATRLLARLVATAPYREGVSTVKKRRLQSGAAAQYDYGHLRDNLRVRRVKGRVQGRIIFQVTTGNAFWARFYEFGTATQRARPWMRPQTEMLSDELVTIQCEELRAGIEAAARKQARKLGRVMANGRNG